MKKNYIFCLLALFTHISMAQMNFESSMSDMFTQLFPPIDTVEIKSNDQTYQIIKLSKGVTIFQNKESIFMDHVPKNYPNEKYPEITLYKESEIYKLIKDNISLYTNPDTLLARPVLMMYITSDRKGKIKDVVFISLLDVNIPGYILANIEREIKTNARLIFDMTPVVQKKDFMLYGCMIEKDGLISFGK